MLEPVISTISLNIIGSLLSPYQPMGMRIYIRTLQQKVLELSSYVDITVNMKQISNKHPP